ncbi:hypothetical protein EJ070_22195 [Mesorhizobium sp. M1E.F.Ca.ET.045.02.1.1]|nr:hypothetical protein EJ070_22195 [Mesorhizobium sp. M1E.F.Ca.ET.045.02.1.1]RUW33129.1 hypothetical protein EOA38_13845 [Mesorhizobium sp. M1E.F.Ca.ET.041.01.1.1]RUW76395.1 hypothetical protein EOA29_27830 [Mesorhizobium sp. M1E.F.Ca.ET.063.01.1.1]RWD86768.1 MAG: hypothetical protein EOS38_20250 [Mesorhizobium sp.]RWD90128.1 MAG: hypothetical protein EOS39_19580 [Mesorhizobium sp.]
MRPACKWCLPALPVLTYFQVRSAPAFAGRSPHKGLRSMKATAGVGRFSETTIFDTACPRISIHLRGRCIRLPKPIVA